ncbi:MAG: pyruvate kinase [Candidatus Woesearchaeota archaeon]|jgi:pyruvate kinase
MNKINAIVTIPPYAPFIKEVAAHPIVCGLRLNTVMPVKENLEEVLKRLNGDANGKNLWIDLKGRQLRVTGYGVPPFTEIDISHEIYVKTPTTAYFSDGKEYATLLKINNKKLIMQDGPKRVVGPGEAINIPDESLRIKGYFTDTDLKYIEAGLKTGVNNYMLSFIESKKDIDDFRKFYKDANVVAKIESRKGMNYVSTTWNKDDARLMAARGDLYIEVKKPHEIITCVENIVKKNNDAIVASRIFPSLSNSLEPSCEDLGDVDNLLRMGYKTVMFGDDVCLKRESILNALNLFDAMAEKYQK